MVGLVVWSCGNCSREDVVVLRVVVAIVVVGLGEVGGEPGLHPVAPGQSQRS